MEVLESPGKVLEFFVSKRVGTLSAEACKQNLVQCYLHCTAQF